MDINETTVKQRYRKLSNNELIDLRKQGGLDDRFVPILNEVLSDRGISKQDIDIELCKQIDKEKLLAGRTVEEISSQYEAKDIAFKRASATIIDYIMLAFIILFVFLFCDLLNIGNGKLLLFISTIIFYIVFGEWFFGKTIGKYCLNISVVNSAGKKPSLFQVLTRTTARIFELNPSILGGLPAWVLVTSTKRRQRLGDIVADTFVISDADLKLMNSLNQNN